MTTGKLQPHEVVPAGLGVIAKRGQACVHAVTTDAVQVLWKGDSLPSRGQASSRSGTVVEVTGVLVYRVERYLIGLYGTFAERSRCSVDIEDTQHRTIRPTLDSASGIVDGIAVTGTLRHINRYSAFQRPQLVADTPLQDLPGRFATRSFRTDYMTRLRALLPTPPSMKGEPASPPETVRGATPRSTRRSHQPSRLVRVMSEAVGELPVLTIQDPADMVGVSVDCRPPGLPVSKSLSELSPRTVENARGTSGFNPSRREGQSIMDMDMNEITINRIVGFPWNDPGTDVEDELPTPASSPVQCTTPAVMTGESGGPQELRDNFDLNLAKVLLDVSVMTTMVSPIEDSIVIETTEVAEYAAPEIPTVETVTESPGIAVPQESRIVTNWVPRYSPISMTSTVGGEARPMSTVQPSPYLPPVMATPPPSCTETLDQFLPNMPSPLGEPSQSPGQEDMTKEPETEVFIVEASKESPSAMGHQADQVGGPDLSREGPFEVHDVPPTSGQSPLVLNSLPGCQYCMTSYDDRDSRADLDPA